MSTDAQCGDPDQDDATPEVADISDAMKAAGRAEQYDSLIRSIYLLEQSGAAQTRTHALLATMKRRQALELLLAELRQISTELKDSARLSQLRSIEGKVADVAVTERLATIFNGPLSEIIQTEDADKKQELLERLTEDLLRLESKDPHERIAVIQQTRARGRISGLHIAS